MANETIPDVPDQDPSLNNPFSLYITQAMVFTYSPNNKEERQGVRKRVGGQDGQALAYG